MSFAEILRGAAERRGLSLPGARHPEPLASLAYEQELALKQDALQAFWRAERLPGRPDPIVPAPVPRGYRTTTKRRAYLRRELILAFPGAGPPGRAGIPSRLDSPEHTAVYSFLTERMSRPAMRPLASVLNWAVVRGTPGALALLLNLRRFDARVVRLAKQLAEALQKAPLGVRSGFLYLDPTGSDYYLEARRPAGMLSFKRLFGPDRLQVAAGGVRLRFPPTVFSQVNGPMLETMTGWARTLLAPPAGCALLDLYCGYGLFAFTVGREAEQVTGIDFDGPAVEAARANAKHLGVSDRARFIAGSIDGELLERRVRRSSLPEVALLDPPRQGTSEGVAGALASRGPVRVLHICCGTAEIPREIGGWEQAGYRVKRIVPLDLFAGTAGLETMLLLERRGGSRAG